MSAECRGSEEAEGQRGRGDNLTPNSALSTQHSALSTKYSALLMTND
ncbi:hypothetical protein [Nostoc sp. DedQUE09]|nr:hypothetical protein [Nostoc sp. DedQUE09]MDZ7954890.1 hypothetical protein [Nostoc sp. DedQUE09]